MSERDLHHLIYTSTATGPIERNDLVGILATARVANAKLGITGMLLFSEGTFFQVLEGTEPAINQLLARIASDTRHRAVVSIIHEPISKRAFGEWTMGFAQIDGESVESGLSDFFQAGESLGSMPEGRARKLLSAFGQGRWRTRLGELP